MPVVPLILRTVQKDVKLGDTLVPRNALLVLHMLAMHVSERYWERPKEFIPVSIFSVLESAILIMYLTSCLGCAVHSLLVGTGHASAIEGSFLQAPCWCCTCWPYMVVIASGNPKRAILML